MSIFHKLKTFLSHKNILPFLGLGISVQAPINLIGGTLKWWASDSGLNLAAIGIFAAVTMPYSLKFLWAPFIDQINLPFSKRMGCKRVWCFVFQLGILAGLLFISCLNPKVDVWPLFFGSLLIGFCGASQALTVDALKIDLLKKEELTDGTTVKEFGGRLGYLGATAGMFALSMYFSWNTAYKIASLMILIGVFSLFFIQEPPKKHQKISFHTTIKMPFMEFCQRINLPLLCLFIVLYKLCNGMLGSMAYPFYNQIGFTAKDVLAVSSIFGTIMTALGILIGGIILHKMNLRPLLFVLGCIEIFTSIAFAGLAAVGPSIPLFVVVIIFDNIIGGIGSAAWVVFISRMCSKSFSATQYGFLDALTMIPLTLLGMLSGWLALHMGWQNYFIFTGALMIPALCMVKYCDTLFEKK